MNGARPPTPACIHTPPNTPPRTQLKVIAPQYQPLTPDSCARKSNLKVVVPPQPTFARDFEGSLSVDPKPVGIGSFSWVYRAQSQPEHGAPKVYAVKVAKKGAFFDTFTNELRALNVLNTPGHPNVVHLYGVHQQESLVLDFYETDLYSAVRKYKSSEIFEPIVGQETWTKWASELAFALEYIHSKDIIHGDLKPNNILLNIVENGQHSTVLKPVIADFSSSIVGNGASQVTSPIYSAPEVQSGGEPTKESDIYALGVILIFCASGQEPYSQAKNAYQRVMWQKSVLPMDACGDASIRVNQVRGVVEGMVVGRSLGVVTGH